MGELMKDKFAIRCLGMVVAVFLGTGAPAATSVPDDGFCLDLDVDFSDVSAAEALYEVPGSFRVVLRFAGADKELLHYDERFGNYLNFRLPGGAAPVVEAQLPTARHSPRPCMRDDLPPGFRVGVPFGALRRTDGVHRVRVVYAQTRWHIDVDGEQVDEDLLVEPIPWPQGATGRTLSARVKKAAFRTPAPDGVFAEPAAKPIREPIQYWTAGGFNTWVGDVVVCERKDRFHVFYLKDRRHHRGKGCTGGHYFAHVSSTNLVDWFEHPVVTPITNWWFTCGTGTPFVYGGKLCLSYGLHSTRFVPPEQTTEPAMLADCRKNGKMGLYRFGELPGVPLGATYAVSDDDIHFNASGILFHTTQNPALYNRKDGRLGLVAGFSTDSGRWVSDSISGWELYDDKMPVKGDCPCLFEWNGHHYVLQGFVGYAHSPNDLPGSYRAWRGTDIYDGLNVPMVAPWKDGRRLLVGWVHHFYGWGGWLVFRELVQRADGTLGTKWVPEIAPPTPPATHRVAGGQSFRLRFASAVGGKRLEFHVNAKTGELHFADVLQDGSLAKFSFPHGNGNFRISGTRGLDKPYEVRLVRHYDRKSNVTLFDAEVAGNRTIICRRPGVWTDGVIEECRQ